MPLVAANWKMNGSLAENESLLEAILALPNQSQRVICPPAVYLQQVATLIAGSDIALGAQNIDWRESGAFTGEVSGQMAKDVGADFVIVGHSERRSLFGETDENCAAKVAAALAAGLKPILCVGETKAQRDAGEALQVVSRQLKAALSQTLLAKVVVAYEPVWAIGTGDTATPQQAAEVHDHIRHELGRLDAEQAGAVKILYGGSVNADNAASLFAMENIDGALVGGASLKAKEFSAICCAA